MSSCYFKKVIYEKLFILHCMECALSELPKHAKKTLNKMDYTLLYEEAKSYFSYFSGEGVQLAVAAVRMTAPPPEDTPPRRPPTIPTPRRPTMCPSTRRLRYQAPRTWTRPWLYIGQQLKIWRELYNISSVYQIHRHKRQICNLPYICAMCSEVPYNILCSDHLDIRIVPIKHAFLAILLNSLTYDSISSNVGVFVH